MAQQITVYVLVDSHAAFEANQLDGNIYLMDNLRTEGSENQGTGQLVTAVNGTAWSNGAQANEPLLNWLVTGLSSLPVTLPRNYLYDRSRDSERAALEAVRRHSGTPKGKAGAAGGIDALTEAAGALGVHARFENEHGQLQRHRLQLLDLRGEVVPTADPEADDIHQLPPIITDITGEAVDEGILYPAQYGTPVPINAGWYWSATASTSRPGVYSYTMHIKVYKLIFAGGKPIWQDKDMTYESQIRVRTRPMVNGFTGGGIGLLPIY